MYSNDPWSLVETSFDPSRNHSAETIFYVGNGYLGLRGNLEEGWEGPAEATEAGTYVAGWYEDHPVRHPEPMRGYNTHESVMLNSPTARPMVLRVDGVPVTPTTGTLTPKNYERRLDLRTGRMSRKFEWSNGTIHLLVKYERQAHMGRGPTATFKLDVEVIKDCTSLIEVTCSLDVNRGDNRENNNNDPRLGMRSCGGDVVMCDNVTGVMLCRTQRTQLSLGVAVSHTLSEGITTVSPNQIFRLEGAGGHKKFCLERHVAYVLGTSECVMANAITEAATLAAIGSASLWRSQDEYMRRFWDVADIEISGDVSAQQGMRYNALALLMSLGDNMGAKGLSGEGYSGHYFWDSEMYIAPRFLHTCPELAKRFVLFRCKTLGGARVRASEMSLPGALYPWRTIGGGESSSYFPAGTAQLHINADIAHFIKEYVVATGDVGVLKDDGAADVVWETARVYGGWGHYIGDRFHIHGVTGPDEYNALVDDNMYTNVMAQAHLRYAVQIKDFCSVPPPESEAQEFTRMADAMFLPPPNTNGVYPQDASFLTRKPWPEAWASRPLLMHYHPMVIYRHMISKQADLVFLMMIHPEVFESIPSLLESNFTFYERITTHDSSLSTCVFSVMASRLGLHEKAYQYFEATARMDLDDSHGNTCHGIHAACMAGAWACVTKGFAGFHVDHTDGIATFKPHLPSAWTGYSFCVVLQGSRIRVRVAKNSVRYELEVGGPVTIRHRGIPISSFPCTMGIIMGDTNTPPTPMLAVLPVTYTGEAHGRGVFAQTQIPRGQLIETAPCIAFTQEAYQSHVRHTVLEHYVYTYSHGMLLALGLGCLFNHHDPPNVDYRVDSEAMCVRYYTARDVSVGEELFIFYGPNMTF